MTWVVVDDGTRLAYRLDGPSDAPVVLFINSLGTSLQMRDPQVAATVARWSLRGSLLVQIASQIFEPGVDRHRYHPLPRPELPGQPQRRHDVQPA
jgi:hypothetical protein